MIFQKLLIVLETDWSKMPKKLNTYQMFPSQSIELTFDSYLHNLIKKIMAKICWNQTPVIAPISTKLQSLNVRRFRDQHLTAKNAWSHILSSDEAVLNSSRFKEKCLMSNCSRFYPVLVIYAIDKNSQTDKTSLCSTEINFTSNHRTLLFLGTHYTLIYTVKRKTV